MGFFSRVTLASHPLLSASLISSISFYIYYRRAKKPSTCPFPIKIQFSALVPPKTCIVCVEIILICCQFVTTFENFINFCQLLSLFIVLKERTSFVHNCNGIWVKEDVFFNSLTSNYYISGTKCICALYCV